MSEKFFAVWFALCAILSLALTGFAVWVVIELLQWVTSK